jgi:hypothetical protein
VGVTEVGVDQEPPGSCAPGAADRSPGWDRATSPRPRPTCASRRDERRRPARPRRPVRTRPAATHLPRAATTSPGGWAARRARAGPEPARRTTSARVAHHWSALEGYPRKGHLPSQEAPARTAAPRATSPRHRARGHDPTRPAVPHSSQSPRQSGPSPTTALRPPPSARARPPPASPVGEGMSPELRPTRARQRSTSTVATTAVGRCAAATRFARTSFSSRGAAQTPPTVTTSGPPPTSHVPSGSRTDHAAVAGADPILGESAGTSEKLGEVDHCDCRRCSLCLVRGCAGADRAEQDRRRH